MWPVLARRILLLPVVIPVAARGTVRTLATARPADVRWTRGASGLFVCCGDNLGGQAQPENFQDD